MGLREAAFTMLKIWNQLTSPSADEHINKMWYICMHEGLLCSHKKDTAFATKWMELEDAK